MQKRGSSGVGNQWRASSKCQEEESEGKKAKEEEEDAGEGDKEDTEKKDEVAVLVSGSES